MRARPSHQVVLRVGGGCMYLISWERMQRRSNIQFPGGGGVGVKKRIPNQQCSTRKRLVCLPLTSLDAHRSDSLGKSLLSPNSTLSPTLPTFALEPMLSNHALTLRLLRPVTGSAGPKMPKKSQKGRPGPVGPGRPFLRLFRHFGPRGPGTPCNWSLQSQHLHFSLMCELKEYHRNISL